MILLAFLTANLCVAEFSFILMWFTLAIDRKYSRLGYWKRRNFWDMPDLETW